MHTPLKFLLSILILTLSLTLIVYFTYSFAFDYTNFNGERIIDFGLKNEILLVVNLGLLFFAFFKRTFLSILLTVLFYGLFILMNLEKIKFFKSTILPQDLKYIDQLMMIWPIFKPYLTVAILVSVFVIILVLIFIKKEAPVKLLVQLNFAKRVVMFIVIFFISIQLSGLYYSLTWLASYERSRAHSVSTSEKYGLFTTFVRNLLHLSSNTKPDTYSYNRINEIYLSKIKPVKDTEKEGKQSINLIIYLIESFIDPAELGIKTSKNPTPFFHSLKNNHESGFVFSPEIGGRSANAEFEILTGFSKHFFSHSSIPFIDLPFKPIPSIGNELKQKGYFTKVIQASDLGFFNYINAYKMMGFEEIISLYKKAGVKLDYAGRYPADTAIVEEIINSSQLVDPFFLYAFTNSTHGPWKYDDFDASDINLTFEQPLNSEEGEKQLRTYVNALSEADKAIELLVQHFERRSEKTIILILGDHQPGIPEVRQQYMFKKFPGRFQKSDRKKLRRQFNRFDDEYPLESYKTMHKIPYVIWSNFNLKKSKSTTLGMNELAVKIFNMIGHKPRSPYYVFLNEFIKNADYLDILKYVFLGGEKLEKNRAEWVKAYEEIQYDILLGEGYLTEIVEE